MYICIYIYIYMYLLYICMHVPTGFHSCSAKFKSGRDVATSTPGFTLSKWSRSAYKYTCTNVYMYIYTYICTCICAYCIYAYICPLASTIALQNSSGVETLRGNVNCAEQPWKPVGICIHVYNKYTYMYIHIYIYVCTYI